jgi:hypothetical protein
MSLESFSTQAQSVSVASNRAQFRVRQRTTSRATVDMSIRVISSSSAPKPMFRPGDVISVAAGWLLIVAGWLVAVPSSFFVVMSFRDLDPTAFPSLAQLVSVLTVAVGCVFGGYKLIQGRRRVVLFLRRFGFEGSSRALSYAVRTALGRGFRIVTLDDAHLAPSRTHWWVRLGLVAILGYALFELGSIIGIFAGWFSYESVSSPVLFVAKWIPPHDEGVMVYLVDWPVLLVVLTLLGPLQFAIVNGMLTLMVLTMLVPLAAVFGNSYFAVLSAEYRSKRKIIKPDVLKRVTKDVARRGRMFVAPRLAVVTVSEDLWRDSVAELARLVDIVLIDVSAPSANLHWEMANLRNRKSQWVLIGEEARITRLLTSDGSDVRDQELRVLLEGEEVLTYTSFQRPALKEFSTALRGVFEHRAYS